MSTELAIFLAAAALLLFLISRFIRYESKSKGARRLRVLLVLLLSAVLLFCALREWGPRGRNSLFSDAGAGEKRGTDSEQLYQGAQDDGESGISVIIVSGRQVDVGNRSFCFSDEDDGGFSLYAAANFGPEDTIRVIDDYAISDTYKKVISTLGKLGITPDELSE